MTHDGLRTLLADLADDARLVPQLELSRSAWKRSRRAHVRHLALGATAVAGLVAIPVAMLVPGTATPFVPSAQHAQPLRARAAHSATLLADGRVLLIGGCATDGCTTAEGEPESELYAPGRGFTAGPDLVQVRQGHTATRLFDGRVLVVGGWPREGRPPLETAEVYDPGRNAFESVGPLAFGRGGHTATALADGRVLVAGGQTQSGITDTAELFDPRTGTFGPAAPMPTPRDGAAAVALTDGRVLVVGGRDESGELATAVIYDPATDAWLETGTMSTARSKLAVAPLPDGRVLAMGGTPDDRAVLGTTEVYDPATNTFRTGPRMDTGRYKFDGCVDPEGHIVVAGSTQAADPGPSVTPDDDDNIGAGHFDAIAGTSGPTRSYASVTCLPDGDVLVVGGYDDRIRILDDALLISGPLVDADPGTG